MTCGFDRNCLRALDQTEDDEHKQNSKRNTEIKNKLQVTCINPGSQTFIVNPYLQSLISTAKNYKLYYTCITPVFRLAR